MHTIKHVETEFVLTSLTNFIVRHHTVQNEIKEAPFGQGSSLATMLVQKGNQYNVEEFCLSEAESYLTICNYND